MILIYYKKDFLIKGGIQLKKLAYQYEFFNCIGDYQKPVDGLKKKDFFSKLKNDYP